MWRIVKLDQSSFGQRLGRRGLVLLFCGLSWAMVGWQIFSHPNVARFANANNPHPQMVLEWMDSPWLGVLWMVCGLLAALTGIHRSTRSRRHFDAWGFNLILTPAFVWMLSFSWSFLSALLTGGNYGRYESLYGAVVWLLISLFIIVIAGWPEPAPATDPLTRTRSARHRRGRS